MYRLIAKILSSDSCWPLLVAAGKRMRWSSHFEGLFQRVLFERVMSQHEWIESLLCDRLQSTTVSAGPFRGLHYPNVAATCSTIAPKLLGTYEAEIANCFSNHRMSRYEVVVDVGCAEGYYAVGAARCCPQARVDAFDISPQAREMCRELASSNQVADRVAVKEECTADTLKSYEGKRALIISDCEGGEMNLFTPQVIRTLTDADLVIEVHEHLGADSDQLRQRFEQTHQCDRIRCRLDLDRLHNYQHPVIDDLPDAKKILLVAECRSRGNGWLVAKSRS